MIRLLPYRIGSQVRVIPVQCGYALPECLSTGAQVVAVAIETGNAVVRLEGEQFTALMAGVWSRVRASQAPE